MMPTSLYVDGVAVVIDQHAVLLRGSSGSGRSDLALRLIDEGAKLISDEQVELRRDAHRLFVGPVPAMPSELKGMIEVRGMGIVPMPHIEDSQPLSWVVDMAPMSEIERMPLAETAEYLGISIPLLKLDPFAISATAKLRVAVRVGASRILGRE